MSRCKLTAWSPFLTWALSSSALAHPRLRICNLTGDYDVVLDYSVEGGNTESAIIDAVEELGLKLVARKGAVEIVVIDSAQKPTGN